MQLLVDQFEKFAGAVLQPASAPLTDAQFPELCAQYPDYRIETTAEGDILILSPAHPRTGQRNAAITSQLFAWTEEDGRGEAFDSSAGFFRRNGARRSPDSAWVFRDQLSGLADDAAMWHVTPEFVIELKSASDRIGTLRAKMQRRNRDPWRRANRGIRASPGADLEGYPSLTGSRYVSVACVGD